MLYHILSCQESNLLKIDNIGFSSDPKTCRFGPGHRDLFLIHYVLKGEGIFNGNLVTEGQGFLITPHMTENYFPCKENPWKLLWITSHDSNISEIFDTYNANPQTNIFEYSYKSFANDLSNMIQQNHNVVYSASEILEIFLNLFNHQKKSSAFSNNEDMYYNYAIDYINSNIFRPIYVCDLTEILGISQSYLYKIFKKKCSLSPQAKINNIKLSKAINMLKQTSMQVTNIAYSLGFSTPQDFSKFFKKHTGISPTHFKNTILKK